MKEDLIPHEEEIKKADLLLIRTGFDKVRKEDPKTYQMEGPYLDPDCCTYMIETFPDLRTVGFDFLAIGSPCNELAPVSHQIMLGFTQERFITAIEDMALAEIEDKKITAVYVAPLRIVGVDSSQVSIIAELED